MITTKQFPALPLFIIVGFGLLFQLTGHYYAAQWFHFGDFWGLWVIVRIILPIILISIIGIPFTKLFLGLPTFDRATKIALGISLVVLALLFMYLNFFADDYLSLYRRGQSLDTLKSQNRFEHFLVFTLSTMTGWEFLHRGFLLGGILYCLTKFMDTPEKSSTVIAILMVCIFEVLFHIIKPIYEPYAFIPASLFFSWLTIRCQSLWPAMLLHFAIEINFAFAAFVGF